MTDKKTIFERGFKTKAENQSNEYRKKLGIQVWEPLCAFDLAKFLEIIVVPPSDIFTSQGDIDSLCGTLSQQSGWSALVMDNAYNERLVIHNTNHSPGRQQSNIMHEIAHILCGHKIPEKYKSMLLPSAMVYKDAKQEAEAEYLGAALQMSKACLFWALKRDMTYPEIAEHFIASEEMVRYRINASGVAKQKKYMT